MRVHRVQRVRPASGRLVQRGRFLGLTGLTAGGFLSLTAFQAEGCGITRRAISMKSALRDWLSVSYVTQYPVPHIFSFPLEGKCLEEAKGCTGQSTDRMLHRGPDRQSAAPERSDAQRTANPVRSFLPALIDEWRRDR